MEPEQQDEEAIFFLSDKSKITTKLSYARKYFKVIDNIKLDSSSNEFPLDLKQEDFNLLLDFVNYHRLDIPMKQIPKPIPSKDLQLFIDQWDYNYISSKTEQQLLSLINTANYLNCQEVLDLACAYISSILLSKTLNEIKQEYGILEDFTPELEAKIRKENEYIFQHTKFEKMQPNQQQ